MNKKHTKKRVVIVGGGFAGVKVALLLADKPHFEVTLISNSTNFEYHGALYRTATGNSPIEVIIPLRELFQHISNVTVVLDAITRLKSDSNAVKGADGQIYPYDTLILALGNEINYFGLTEMEEKTYTANTMRRTIALRHELVSRFKSGQPTSIAIVGGGPSGVELAGSIDAFAKNVATKYSKKYIKPSIMLIEGADRLLSVLDPVLSAKVYKRLKSLGVDIRLSTKVNSCEVGKVCLNTGDINADVIIWTAGNRLPEFYELNASEFQLDRGKVAVDTYLRAKGHHNIFVTGDNAATQYSGMAQTALNDANYIVENLLREQKKRKLKPYQPQPPVYSVPVGQSWAVYQSAKHQLSGYKAWLFRRRGDLAIYKNFEPYKRALKQWRSGNHAAKY